MKATGVIQITDDLTLENPTLEVSTVNYNWITDDVNLEIIFSEGVYRHSRTFSFNNGDKNELSCDDVYLFISNHPILGVFE